MAEKDRELFWDPKDLCIESWPPEPKSGMLLGTSNGVKITHTPTGLSATADTERSQHHNRDKALAELRAAIGSAMQDKGQQEGVDHG